MTPYSPIAASARAVAAKISISVMPRRCRVSDDNTSCGTVSSRTSSCEATLSMAARTDGAIVAGSDNTERTTIVGCQYGICVWGL